MSAVANIITPMFFIQMFTRSSLASNSTPGWLESEWFSQQHFGSLPRSISHWNSVSGETIGFPGGNHCRLFTVKKTTVRHCKRYLCLHLALSPFWCCCSGGLFFCLVLDFRGSIVKVFIPICAIIGECFLIFSMSIRFTSRQ